MYAHLKSCHITKRFKKGAFKGQTWRVETGDAVRRLHFLYNKSSKDFRRPPDDLTQISDNFVEFQLGLEVEFVKEKS